MAQDLQTLLEGSGKVKSVHIAAITSYEQLQDLIPSLGRLPAAVVCFGAGDFGTNADLRNMTPGILLVDKFEATVKKKALGVWTVLDEVSDLFVPKNGARSAVNLNGVVYLPDGFRPIACDKTSAAYLLELKSRNAWK